jgi:predicted MPP superfamily phosphohydrolase
MPRLEKGPSRYNSRVRVGRRTAIKGLVATGLGAVTGTALYGVGYERHRIGVTEATLPVSGLAPPLDGLRIGLVTDIHHSRMVPADDVTQAVQLVMAAQPDIIVLGGDYVTWGERGYVGPVAELLAPLAAPHGIFAILGNHDDDRDMPAALQAKRFTVLKDQRTHVVVRGERLEIAGIRFWTRRAPDLARVLRGATDTVLLLAHDPRRLREAAALNVPAVLSGHTHGGQVVLPGFGALARRRFPVVQGLGSQDNTSIFVSRGVGTVYVPIRVNCPPEVAVVTLRRKSEI